MYYQLFSINIVLSFIMALCEGMAYIWSGAYGDIN